MATWDEREESKRIIARVKQNFPAVDDYALADLVRSTFREFVGRPVQDYIPVLVERLVRSAVRASGGVLAPSSAISAA